VERSLFKIKVNATCQEGEHEVPGNRRNLAMWG
jgi:hypothetical protein